MDIIRLGMGMLILMAVNIVLGSLSAMFQDSFNCIKFRQGITKAGLIVVCFGATYFVGYLNPHIVAIEVNGIEVTVLNALQLVILAGYYHYAKQVIEKLTEIINGNIFTSEVEVFGKHKPAKNDTSDDEPQEE